MISLTGASAFCETARVKGIRSDTLARICIVLDCQPGDILEAAPRPSVARKGVGEIAP